MGVVKISVGGTWKEAKTTTTTTQTCEACKYNCTGYCAGSCTGGCGACSGYCYGGCNNRCSTTCKGCSGGCGHTCYGCNSYCSGGNRAFGTKGPGRDYPGTSNTKGTIGTQYGTIPSTQTTSTTVNTGRVNVGGGVQTDIHNENKRWWYLEDHNLTLKGGFHLWAA